MNILDLIEKFIAFIQKKDTVDNDIIYNEISLQHELGIFLRNKLSKSHFVEFERNVKEFIDKPNKFAKKEIDLVIRPKNKKIKESIGEAYAIELKYPRNKAFPMRMNQFEIDKKFMNQLKQAGFKKTYSIVIVEQSGFYLVKRDKTNNEKLYKKYRTIQSINDSGKFIALNGNNWRHLDYKKLDKKGEKCHQLYYIDVFK